MRTLFRKNPACKDVGGTMNLVTESSFDSAVSKSGTPAAVIFTSPQCKPCKLMAADLEELESEYSDRVAFFRVDASTEPKLVSRLSVVSTPTLILFVDGKPVLRLVGYKTSRDMRTKIDEQLRISSK